MHSVQILTRYKAWADDVFLATVASLPRQALIAPQPIYFGSLIRTLHHAYAMDVVWQAHLLGMPHGLTSRNPEQCPELDELITHQHRIDAWYIHYAESHSAAALQEVVDFDFIGGGRGAMTRSEILLHAVNHATYHRGHVAGMLYRFDIFPPTTDLPVFLRQRTACGAVLGANQDPREPGEPGSIAGTA